METLVLISTIKRKESHRPVVMTIIKTLQHSHRGSFSWVNGHVLVLLGVSIKIKIAFMTFVGSVFFFLLLVD